MFLRIFRTFPKRTYLSGKHYRKYDAALNPLQNIFIRVKRAGVQVTDKCLLKQYLPFQCLQSQHQTMPFGLVGRCNLLQTDISIHGLSNMFKSHLACENPNNSFILLMTISKLKLLNNSCSTRKSCLVFLHISFWITFYMHYDHHIFS